MIVNCDLYGSHTAEIRCWLERQSIEGGVDFSNLAISLGEGAEAASINYGVFINTVLDFVIVAFAIFMVIKGLNSMKKKEEEKPAEPPKPSKEEVLLTEIRDLLAKQ